MNKDIIAAWAKAGSVCRALAGGGCRGPKDGKAPGATTEHEGGGAITSSSAVHRRAGDGRSDRSTRYHHGGIDGDTATAIGQCDDVSADAKTVDRIGILAKVIAKQVTPSHHARIDPAYVGDRY